MKIKTLITILLASFLLIAFSDKALSQTTSVAQTTTIQKGRLFTTDGQKITFYSLIIGDGVYKYQRSRNDLYQDIPSDKVVKIEKQTGNMALIGGVFGGLVGLGGGFLVVSETNSELGSAGSVNSGTKTAVVVSMTAIIGLVGALAGNGQKKYSTVYSNSKFNTGLNPNFNINLVFNNNVKGLGIRYVFY